jgi:GNAT superfamily N-acetyltransferase
MIASVHRRGSVRAPGPDDVAALVAMFERCSFETRYARFLSPVATFPPGHLAHVVRPRLGRWSWVTVDENSARVVALASLFWNGRGAAELGLLVEDKEQDHGLGTRLLGVIAATATYAGIDTLVAATLAQSHHVRRMLERLGAVSVSCAGPTCEVRVDLAAP